MTESGEKIFGRHYANENFSNDILPHKYQQIIHESIYKNKLGQLIDASFVLFSNFRN